METSNLNTDTDVSGVVDHASDSVHKAINSASEKVHPAVDSIASRAHHATDNIAGAATQAAEAISAKSEQLVDAQSRLLEDCRGYVKDRPLTSIGIAIGAGYLLHWWFRKR